eukprot:scaffold46444_cov21-Tisochrysis_lutea.AAC.1
MLTRWIVKHTPRLSHPLALQASKKVSFWIGDDHYSSKAEFNLKSLEKSLKVGEQIDYTAKCVPCCARHANPRRLVCKQPANAQAS